MKKNKFNERKNKFNNRNSTTETQSKKTNLITQQTSTLNALQYKLITRIKKFRFSKGGSSEPNEPPLATGLYNFEGCGVSISSCMESNVFTSLYIIRGA